MTTTTVTSTPRRAGRREWIGLAALTLPCLIVAMDLTVLNLAVPLLSADLQPSAAQLLWIVDSYGFVMAAALITIGTLGDRIGQRRLLLLGAAAFGITSVLAAFAGSAGMLIGVRALLGLAGAALMPSSLALIHGMFHDPRQRTAAIGIWSSSFSLGGVLGPLLGGLVLEHFWWGSAFLIGVPVMVLLLVAAPALLPEVRQAGTDRFDVVSAALSLVAVLAVVYGVKRFAESGVDPLVVTSVVLGLALGAVFLRRQRRLPDPLIDLKIFATPRFGVSLGATMLSCFVLFATFLVMAQYLQLVLGLAPLAAGLWTLPSSVAYIAGANLGPALTRYARPGVVIGAGFAVAAVGFVVFAQAGTGGLAALVAGSVLFCLGLAPAFVLGTDLAVATAPPEQAGAAAALSTTSTELGSALGIALIGSLAVAGYRGAMGDTAPEGVPAEALDSARDTLGAAAGAAQQLPAGPGTALLDSAYAAFADAVVLTSLTCAVLALAGAVTAVTVLRRAGSDARPGSE